MKKIVVFGRVDGRGVQVAYHDCTYEIIEGILYLWHSKEETGVSEVRGIYNRDSWECVEVG